MLTEARLRTLKERLLSSQSKMIMQMKETQMEAAKDAVGELSSYDNHPADMGTELYDREKDLVFRQTKEQELEAINEALHAMDDGTYGVCRVCSMYIPYERLEAIPTADTCVEHTDASYIQLGNEDITGNDGLNAWDIVQQFGTSSADNTSD